MSTPVAVISSQEGEINHSFTVEYELKGLNSLADGSLITPVFSPIPRIELAFYFEIWYKCIRSKPPLDYYDSSVFTISLVKSRAVDILQSLKMKVKIKLCYYDGTLLKKLNSPNEYVVDTMDNVEFESYRTPHNTFASDDFHPTTHLNKMHMNDSLKMVCKLTFFGHLNFYKDIYREKRLLKNREQFAKDFKTIVDPCKFNDITIKIQDVSRSAHKAVLAAHSPVFLNMLTHDFKESKTNTIIIEDTSSDIFDVFLMYLYSGEIEDASWDTIKELYVLADKYDVGTLKIECCEIITSYICIEKICEILQMAFDYNDSELKKEAKKFASENIEDILSEHKEEWAELIEHDPLIAEDVLKDSNSEETLKKRRLN